MKNLLSFCAAMYFLITHATILGQQPLNVDLYKPMPLQAYTPPKDPANKENKLLMYDMLEHKLDYLEIGRHFKHHSLKFLDEDNAKFNKNDQHQKNPVYSFKDVLPADLLPEFPNAPMSSVVKLFLTFFNPVNLQMNYVTCSGLLISPDFILTCAHCVKSKFDSSYAVACTVFPAYNLGKRPFGLTTTTQWYAFSQWTTNGNLDYDIAIMRLAQPIGNSTGWINLGYQSDTSFFTSPSNDFYSFGYPGVHPLGTPVFEEGERMYYMNGFMDFWRTDKTICHYNIGYGGQSGSGLFHQDSSNVRRAYAVLSHGNIFPPYHTCHCRMHSSMFLYTISTIRNFSN